MVLSKVLQEVLTLKAANIQLRDIVDYNKITYPEALQNFFILQEVYGHNEDINSFDTSITTLELQRRTV